MARISRAKGVRNLASWESLRESVRGALGIRLISSRRASFLAFPKAAMLGKCGRIAGTMQNPNDHKLMLTMQVVDGIVARKTNAEPAREVFSRRGCKWKVKQPVAILLDLVDETRRCGL
jgi:hypothetical protein